MSEIGFRRGEEEVDQIRWEFEVEKEEFTPLPRSPDVFIVFAVDGGGVVVATSHRAVNGHVQFAAGRGTELFAVERAGAGAGGGAQRGGKMVFGASEEEIRDRVL